MKRRALDTLIDACILLDWYVRLRVVDRVFLWAWHKRQVDDGVLLYDAATRKWYRCE